MTPELETPLLIEDKNYKIKPKLDIETKKFQICDHLFRSYLDCIHTFSVEKKDCIQICDTLEKIDLCKIKVK
jgi:superfamily II RNA helicase